MRPPLVLFFRRLEAVEPVSDNVFNATGANRYDRQTGSHRLQNYHALGFGDGGEQEGIPQSVPGGHFVRRHGTNKGEVLLKSQVFDLLLQAVLLVAIADHQEPEGHMGFPPQGINGLNHEVDVFLVREPGNTDKHFLIPELQLLPELLDVLFLNLLELVIFNAGRLHEGRCFNPDHPQIFLRGVGRHDHTVALVGKAFDQRVRNQVPEQHAG